MLSALALLSHFLWIEAPSARNVEIAPTKIVLTAGKIDRKNVIAMARIPGQAKSPFTLVEQPTGRVVALQPIDTEEDSSFAWLIPSLTANQSLTYELSSRRPASDTDKGVELKQSERGLEVLIGGKFFTEYRTKDGPKPYLWPIIGPTGEPVTRAYPMKKNVAGESHDHDHHRSLWFTHGTLNKRNFWSEGGKSSTTVHTEFGQIQSGPVFGAFTSKVDWIGNDKMRVCKDERTFRIYATSDVRIIDVDLRLKATDGNLTFGDDKEGTFALRIADSMRLVQGAGVAKGTIVNSAGDRDKSTWGKRAAWCDYSGPVAGKTVGIALFDHSQNLRHPTYWHVRDYGLFGANPFGVSYFTSDKKQNGSYELAAGGELRLRYRLYIHQGTAEDAHIADRYAEYAKPLIAELK